MRIEDTEAYACIFDLIDNGKLTYDDLDLEELNEVTALLYKEGSDMERHEWVCDGDFSTNIYEEVGAVLLKASRGDTKPKHLEHLLSVIQKTLIQSTAYKARETFNIVVNDLRENDELCRQDSEYLGFEEPIYE